MPLAAIRPFIIYWVKFIAHSSSFWFGFRFFLSVFWLYAYRKMKIIHPITILITLPVPPMIWVPNQLIGATVGDEIALECDTEAFPLSLNYWTREEKSREEEIMIVNSDKYRMSNTENSYKVQMKLIIKKISTGDYGNWRIYFLSESYWDNIFTS